MKSVKNIRYLWRTKNLLYSVMSLALPYAHMPPIFTFLTLPIEPDYTTVTAIQCNLV